MPIAARCSAWLGDLASTLIFSPRFGIQQRAGYAIQRLLPERAIFSDLDGFCRRNFADAMQCGSERAARSEGAAGAHRPRDRCPLTMHFIDDRLRPGNTDPLGLNRPFACRSDSYVREQTRAVAADYDAVSARAIDPAWLARVLETTEWGWLLQVQRCQ